MFSHNVAAIEQINRSAGCDITQTHTSLRDAFSMILFTHSLARLFNRAAPARSSELSRNAACRASEQKGDKDPLRLAIYFIFAHVGAYNKKGKV